VPWGESIDPSVVFYMKKDTKILKILRNISFAFVSIIESIISRGDDDGMYDKCSECGQRFLALK